MSMSQSGLDLLQWCHVDFPEGEAEGEEEKLIPLASRTARRALLLLPPNTPFTTLPQLYCTLKVLFCVFVFCFSIRRNTKDTPS